MVEIWQANAAGRYGTRPTTVRTSRSRTASAASAAPGRRTTERFEFVTVKPGRVPWPEGGLQAPHIEVGIFARGLLKRAVTRIYFPDEAEANEADPVLSRLSPERRETLIAVAEDGGLRFDIRLQGPQHTTFFAG